MYELLICETIAIVEILHKLPCITKYCKLATKCKYIFEIRSRKCHAIMRYMLQVIWLYKYNL